MILVILLFGALVWIVVFVLMRLRRATRRSRRRRDSLAGGSRPAELALRGAGAEDSDHGD